MEEEEDDDEADYDGFFEKITLKRGNRILNKTRTVVARDNLHAGRQRRGNLAKLLLYPLDYV